MGIKSWLRARALVLTSSRWEGVVRLWRGSNFCCKSPTAAKGRLCTFSFTVSASIPPRCPLWSRLFHLLHLFHALHHLFPPPTRPVYWRERRPLGLTIFRVALLLPLPGRRGACALDGSVVIIIIELAPLDPGG
jgi:hypothetical protein